MHIVDFISEEDVCRALSESRRINDCVFVLGYKEGGVFGEA